MKGITSLPLFTEKQHSNGKYVMEFDFNWIIPMPSALDLQSGGTEDLAIEAAFRQDAVARCKYGRNWSAMSERMYREKVAMSDKTSKELAELGLKYLNNLELYGATTWYGWCKENWGTKWNAYESTSLDTDTIIFSTAWSAPQKVIAQLAKMYSDAEIEHWWADEDMGCNTGYAKYSGGKLIEQLCHDTCSNNAYETYILCWGECECLYQNEDGLWQRRDCAECDGCGGM